MRVGAVFPQTEIGNDPGVVRGWAEAVEGSGYTHVVAFDHVLGANPDRPGWTAHRPYSHETPFHEVFVLLSFLAAWTQRLELATGILILPQRQTALVAKQAASLDVLSGGRLRLGVGLGWNEVEYEALGETFTNRGRRVEEQIEVLRRLWADPLVTFDGRWHRISDAGINPLPLNRRLPLWMGGNAPAALERIARLADGWMVNTPLGEQLDAQLAGLRRMVEEAARDPSTFGLEGRVLWRGDADAVMRDLDAWDRHGVSHLSITTMGARLSPAAHAETLVTLARLRGGG